jgi:glycosyltransferase involved in cell wall biosynthesis
LAQRFVWDTQDLKLIRRLLKEWMPDVVSSFHITHLTHVLLPFLAQFEVPLVHDEGGWGLLEIWKNHGDWFEVSARRSEGRIKRGLRRVAVEFVQKLSGNLLPTEWSWPTNMFIYFNSEFNRQRHAEAGVPVSGAKVLRQGIDLNRFGFKAGRRNINTIKLLLPGRIAPGKGIEYAVRAIAVLKSLRPQQRCQLQIIGPIQDALYHETILREVHDLSLKDDVVFTPPVSYDRMWEAYQSADFCLMLSQWESLPTVLLEAMASGSVLVTSAFGGGREIVRDGGNAVIVPEAAPGRVAEEVIRLLESEVDYLRIQPNARRYVEENHTLESYVDKVEAVLSEAATRGN